jgi:hypothetical protein
MQHEEKQTHVVIEWDASAAALVADKVLTREDVIALYQDI